MRRFALASGSICLLLCGGSSQAEAATEELCMDNYRRCVVRPHALVLGIAPSLGQPIAEEAVPQGVTDY